MNMTNPHQHEYPVGDPVLEQLEVVEKIVKRVRKDLTSPPPHNIFREDTTPHTYAIADLIHEAKVLKLVYDQLYGGKSREDIELEQRANSELSHHINRD